ncbi:MAG TPA: hypothetical protein VGZ22_18940 [Isosphaeraceae bacterium]|jgi:hypothetical protein|nr:hypothetical protein [Isosphaeraceae bacterium]
MSIEFPTQAAPPVPRSAIPVARPAAPPLKLATHDSEEPPEPEALLTPTRVKSWGWSFGLHALLILSFAFWVFTPPHIAGKSFDTRIGEGAGEEGGDSGSLKGTDGLDQTLTLEPPPSLKEPVSDALRPGVIALDPDALLKVAPMADAGGSGVNIPNPGAGGNGDGFGLAKFGHGTELVGGVGVKVGDPQFTLIWDSQADIDLHVIEPGGSEIYWEKPHADKGGELDVDDVDGYGPENVFWVQGQGPPGEYRWFVHYYGGFGGQSVPTHWKVRLKHNGTVTIFKGRLTAIGTRSKIHDFELDAPATPVKAAGAK